MILASLHNCSNCRELYNKDSDKENPLNDQFLMLQAKALRLGECG